LLFKHYFFILEEIMRFKLNLAGNLPGFNLKLFHIHVRIKKEIKNPL